MKNAKLLIALPLLLVTGCPGWKPIVKTINDLAYDLCVAEMAKEKPTLSAEDVGKAFCTGEEALKPFIDAILTAKQKLAQAKAAASASTSASVAPPAPVVSTPAPSASASTKPAASAKPAK